MNERTLEVLEYTRIREKIAGYCMSEEGRAALLERVPSVDPLEINRLKSLGQAWLRSLSGETPPQFRGWPPVKPFLSRIQVEGASLAIDEFYALGLFCDSVLQFRTWAEARVTAISSGRRDSLSKSSSVPKAVAVFTSSASSVPISALSSVDSDLITQASMLPDLSEPRDEIFKIIDKSGEIRDLPELRAIRQNIRRIQTDIEKLVNRYLGDENLKSVLQSSLPTIRDGRQVIALRSSFRSRVKGIVHEVSQSGQTVYIEPEDVVDRNNDLVTEEHRFSREVARILRELTARLSPYYAEILSSLDTMIFLDGIGSGSRWGRDQQCVYAEDADLNADITISPLQLRQGRHPLLGTRAVPIDLVLTPGGRILIITGPNTGGKTVSLKTVALFALLNQSGWPIPAAEPTVFPVFDYIGCDIGDEQSLDQSLSTFSGHMKNIARILDTATEKSLILLDELGSGTDPQEGSAIAMAVLDSLLEKKPIVLVTTHHGILKNYGYTHTACINASVDFDQDTLSPTYRILMGVPGESHALDIAGRNGLNPEIVAQARSYLKEERADVSALIRGLTAKHEELSQFEVEKKKEEEALHEKRRKIDLKELQLRQKELELRESGYKQIGSLLDSSRKQLENLVREIREGEMTREKTLQVKTWLTELEESVASEYDGLLNARAETGEMKKDMEELLRQEPSKTHSSHAGRKGTLSGQGGKANTEYLPALSPGVEVYVGAAKRRGTIVRAAKKGFWIITTDSLKMTVGENEISAVPMNGQAKKVSIEVQTDMGGDEPPAFELKLLGMRYDEAQKVLERQLDLASMKGLKEFSIVHGKGHGVLQEMVQSMLKTYSAVSDYHFARPEDGGTGKTIVTLS